MATATDAHRGPRPRWHGRLALGFVRDGERTVVERRDVCMPLAMQRPFYPEGARVAHVLALHPPGGMVGGDRLDIALDVQPGAEALVSTPAAAKWYRGVARAAQQVRHRVAENGRLEWLPQETIVFDGADVEQNLRVELEAGATWFGWDITRFGRSARGERFSAGTWRMATEVWRDGAPLWVDRQRLEGGSRLLSSRFGLADAPVVGTAAWIGRVATAALVDAARAAWDDARLEGEGGVTRLEEGMLCRYRGPSSAAARSWFIAVWELLRMYDRNRPACAPRIWST
ncbi:MAG: urease accessory protein UreD [Sulfurifustis sp.]